MADELMKNWHSYDQSKRLWCIAQKAVTDYAGLKHCIEVGVMGRPQP